MAGKSGFTKSGGSSGSYKGPGSSYKSNNKVGAGQAAPPRTNIQDPVPRTGGPPVGAGQAKPKGKEESMRHERAESPAKERIEEAAAKKAGVGAGAKAKGAGRQRVGPRKLGGRVNPRPAGLMPARGPFPGPGGGGPPPPMPPGGMGMGGPPPMPGGPMAAPRPPMAPPPGMRPPGM